MPQQLHLEPWAFWQRVDTPKQHLVIPFRNFNSNGRDLGFQTACGLLVWTVEPNPDLQTGDRCAHCQHAHEKAMQSIAPPHSSPTVSTSAG